MIEMWFMTCVLPVVRRELRSCWGTHIPYIYIYNIPHEQWGAVRSYESSFPTSHGVHVKYPPYRDPQNDHIQCFNGLTFHGKIYRKLVRFSHEKREFPIIFPLNQSIECWVANLQEQNIENQLKPVWTGLTNTDRLSPWGEIITLVAKISSWMTVACTMSPASGLEIVSAYERHSFETWNFRVSLCFSGISWVLRTCLHRTFTFPGISLQRLA